MDSKTKIADMGASELRLGDGGEIDYTFKHETHHIYNLPEFFHFIKINKTGNTSKNENFIIIEKNKKNINLR